MRTPFERACDEVGGLVALSRLIGKAKQTANHYKRRVPAEVCPLIERATGGKVRCEELRPDVDWSVLRESA